MIQSPQIPAHTQYSCRNSDKDAVPVAIYQEHVGIRQDGRTLNVSVLYLQIDALGTVYYLEIENLTKVHSKISVQGAAVSSRNFFAIV